MASIVTGNRDHIPFLNSLQPTLFEALPALVQPIVSKEATLSERFAAFHELNPQVYHSLVRLARAMQHNGYARWSINGAFEVLRWQQALATHGDAFKLNNSYRSFYSRLIMEREPDLDGFFETRCLLSE